VLSVDVQAGASDPVTANPASSRNGSPYSLIT